MNGFNLIAPVYDGLSTLVFGNSIRRAQQYYLEEARAARKILVIGGGTGLILGALLEINPSCEVWYIEASSRMLDRAKKRLARRPESRVHFIHGTEHDIPAEVEFDVVIANFFFDVFQPPALEKTISLIGRVVSGNGKILVSEFVANGVWWHRIMLTIMYLFFRLVGALDARKLPDWQNQLRREGFGESKSRLFCRAFIKSAVYQRT